MIVAANTIASIWSRIGGRTGEQASCFVGDGEMSMEAEEEAREGGLQEAEDEGTQMPHAEVVSPPSLLRRLFGSDDDMPRAMY